MNNYCVYMYKNKINGKMYIGQTCRSLAIRAGQKGIRYKDSAPKFYAAINKYGWENFEQDILAQNLSCDEANELEQYYIKEYHTWADDPLCQGYNLHPGGRNHIASKETKKKMSKSRKGVTFSEEHCQHIREGLKIYWQDKKKKKKKVRCINNNMIFDSQTEAARWCGLTAPSGISYVCNGKRKTAGKDPVTKEKLFWEYCYI